jgi:hypothetical protein
MRPQLGRAGRAGDDDAGHAQIVPDGCGARQQTR